MVEATALPFHKRVFCETSAGVTAQQRWSRRAREKDHLPADSHTRSVRWPAPLHASALKEHFSEIAYFL